MSTTAKQPEPHSSSKLTAAKQNLQYLAFGAKSGVVPSLRTRSFLTTTRYVLKYAIRRLFRYAKYAAVGAIVAAIGGGLLGTVGSGLAFFAAPSIGVGMSIGVLTAVGKFGWKHRGNHFRFGEMKERAQEGRDPNQDEASDATSTEQKRKQELKERRSDVWMRA
ncbi:hypothetical protein P7C73_g6006, partial [Tremellales sp. Uapishka_1]